MSSALDDLDDFLANEPVDPLRRPPRNRVPVRTAKLTELEMNESLDPGQVLTGVTVFWLKTVFGLTHSTVVKRLAKCPTSGLSPTGHPVYDVKEAAAYLVEPKMDAKTYIRKIRTQELPPIFQKEYWDAKHRKLKYEQAASLLWRTEDVVDVLGEAFKVLRTTMQLLPDRLETIIPMTTGQRGEVQGVTDEMQNEMFEALVTMAKNRRTKNVKAELENDPELEGAEDLDV